jgi:hypothetical protein
MALTRHIRQQLLDNDPLHQQPIVRGEVDAAVIVRSANVMAHAGGELLQHE